MADGYRCTDTGGKYDCTRDAKWWYRYSKASSWMPRCGHHAKTSWHSAIYISSERVPISEKPPPAQEDDGTRSHATTMIIADLYRISDENPIWRTAAIRLESQAARIAELTEALRPFVVGSYKDDPRNEDSFSTTVWVKVGEVRAARRALASAEQRG